MKASVARPLRCPNLLNAGRNYRCHAAGSSYCPAINQKRSLGLSLLRNRGLLAAKDILLDFAGGCFRQLGHKLDSLGTLEVRQMITSVIAQLGFRRGRACFSGSRGPELTIDTDSKTEI